MAIKLSKCTCISWYMPYIHRLISTKHGTNVRCYYVHVHITWFCNPPDNSKMVGIFVAKIHILVIHYWGLTDTDHFQVSLLLSFTLLSDIGTKRLWLQFDLRLWLEFSTLSIILVMQVRTLSFRALQTSKNTLVGAMSLTKTCFHLFLNQCFKL